MQQILKRQDEPAEGDVPTEGRSYLALGVQHWPVLVIATLLCGLLSTAIVLLSPRVYQSSITILVSPPVYKGTSAAAGAPEAAAQNLSELMPQLMPVEMYRLLARSDDLLQQILDETQAESLDLTSLRSALSVELVELGSRTAISGTQYAKMLVFKGQASQPELASEIVQTWVTLFKRRMDELASSGLEESFDFLSERKTEALAELVAAEEEQARFHEEWNLDLMIRLKRSREVLLTDFQSELAKMEIEISRDEAARTAMQGELATEERKQTLFQAPPEEIYWMSERELSDGVPPSVTPDDGLRNEVLNPLFQLARERDILLHEELSKNTAGRDRLRAQIREMEREIERLQKLIVVKSTEETRLKRRVETAEETFDLLAAKLEKAKIARADPQSDVEIVGRAVPPDQPLQSGRLGRIAAGFLVGFLLGLAYLAVRAAVSAQGGQPSRRYRSAVSPVD